MVFVKQKKKNKRYKNFLSDNFFKFTIRAVCRNPRRYIRIDKRAIQMDDSFI